MSEYPKVLYMYSLMLDKLHLQPVEYYVSLLSTLAFQKENGIAINLPVIYDYNNGVIFKILQEHSKIYLAHIPMFHDLILSRGVNVIMADSKLKMYGGKKFSFLALIIIIVRNGL